MFLNSASSATSPETLFYATSGWKAIGNCQGIFPSNKVVEVRFDLIHVLFLLNVLFLQKQTFFTKTNTFYCFLFLNFIQFFSLLLNP